MVELRKLRKTFGPIVAVDEVSFTVGQGEVLGFLGPNGAGKSTTMKMITGFSDPDRGHRQGQRFRHSGTAARSQKEPGVSAGRSPGLRRDDAAEFSGVHR